MSEKIVRDIYEYLTPTAGRMIATKPRSVGSDQVRRTTGGIFIPVESSKMREAFGLVCRVFRTASDVKDYKAGDLVLIHEFGGLPIYSETDDVRAWVITENDVLARVSKSYEKEVAKVA